MTSNWNSNDQKDYFPCIFNRPFLKCLGNYTLTCDNEIPTLKLADGEITDH